MWPPLGKRRGSPDVGLSVALPARQEEWPGADVDVAIPLGQAAHVTLQMLPLVPVKTRSDLYGGREEDQRRIFQLLLPLRLKVKLRRKDLPAERCWRAGMSRRTLPDCCGGCRPRPDARDRSRCTKRKCQKYLQPKKQRFPLSSLYSPRWWI